MTRKSIVNCVVAALTATMLAPRPATADVTPEAAKARLLEMADTLGKAGAYSVEVQSDYDAVQPNGQKVEFGDTRQVLVRRPDGFRIDIVRSDGEQNLIQFDGKTISVATTGQDVYAQADRPGSVDDAVRYFRAELGMQLPLAAMLLTTFRSELESRLGKVEYVESTKRFGKEADHFAAEGKDVDAQFWVSVDDPPLLQRVVITYKNADGEPQYAATFGKWDLSPGASKSKFEFEPAKGAQKIAFASKLVASAPAPADSKPAPAAPIKREKP